jgi:error-prone DNA polymerase
VRPGPQSLSRVGRAEHVADSANGVDQVRLGGVDLLAEVADVGLEHTGVAAEVVAPDVVEELGSGQDSSRIREEVAKQPVLGCRQVDELTGSPHFVSIVVHLEVREHEQFAGRSALAGTTKDGLGASHELGHAERLGHVVVTADGEAPDLVLGGIAGREEENWDVAPVAPEALSDVESVDIGQHHVEQDEVGPERIDLLEGPIPTGSSLDGEALIAKCHRHEFGDGLLIVDDEDARARSSFCHVHIVVDIAGSLLRIQRGDCRGALVRALMWEKHYEHVFDQCHYPGSVVGYAELHCHSNFSFLDGASYPEELVAEAARLELGALALTDHDGLYGVVRFAEAAKEVGVLTVFGAELTLAGRGPDLAGAPVVPAAPRTGTPDPPGFHLVVLARDPEGYSRLARAISEGHLAGGEKGRPRHDIDRLADLAGGHFLILTGCRKGAVPAALVEAGPVAAARELDRLVDRFGPESVVVELFDHDDPLDSARNDALAAFAVRRGLGIVATNVVHHAQPAGRRLASVLASIRAGRPLDELDGWLPAAGAAYLRSGAEQVRRFARYPGAVEQAGELGRACAFDLHLVAPKLPDFPVPAGQSEMSFLRQLVEEGATRRYGPAGAERVPGAWRQLEHELTMIEELGFAGYFLVVWDIVEFCRRSGIYCQGRGSAASSAVCYVLGITNADAVALDLLFERFLSPERDGPPDIDVDIESGRREEVIQYVYGRYGRERAALVAVVVSYRARSAVRDAAKALGHSPGQVDAWARRIERWGSLGGDHHSTAPHRKDRWTWWSAAAEGEAARRDATGGTVGDGRPGRDDVAAEPGPEQAASELGIPTRVLAVATELEGFPRHLGIHPGGMVICDRPVSEVCPVEWARMENRTVLQWDKDDCAAVGLVKFDLLGLGMLEAIHRAVDTIGAYHHDEIDLAMIPQEEAVYDMLCRGDSVGIFQVESRAQMATLPRLRPRCFYDLVVEVALIRPGPIQGGSVHPYLRRRNGAEAVTYLHPCFERSLAKTLGVPLFQEQLMQMAIDAAGFSAAEADQLRQAMGAKRSVSRMERLRARLYAGMAERGITGQIADTVWEQLAAFANFGFPESHSVSFAHLVYVSAWLKLHYPAAFLVALLNSQPMGFWAPHTLVADARRHGVVVLGPEVNKSAAGASLEPAVNLEPGARSDPLVRLGLASVKGIGADLANEIAAGRPYVDMEDLVRRSGIGRPALEALATSGALAGLGEASVSTARSGAAVSAGGAGRRPLSRREALWAAGAAAEARPDRLPGTVVGTNAPLLPEMDEIEEMSADLQTLGLSPGSSPMTFARTKLAGRGVVPNAELVKVPDGARVLVAGVVTHRQRPATAGGTTFLNLEDETGLVNVICSPGCWTRYRKAARSAVVLLVRGRLERGEGADPSAPSSSNVVAEYLEEIDLAMAVSPSRDFH